MLQNAFHAFNIQMENNLRSEFAAIFSNFDQNKTYDVIFIFEYHFSSSIQ